MRRWPSDANLRDLVRRRRLGHGDSVERPVRAGGIDPLRGSRGHRKSRQDPEAVWRRHASDRAPRGGGSRRRRDHGPSARRGSRKSPPPGRDRGARARGARVILRRPTSSSSTSMRRTPSASADSSRRRDSGPRSWVSRPCASSPTRTSPSGLRGRRAPLWSRPLKSRLIQWILATFGNYDETVTHGPRRKVSRLPPCWIALVAPTLIPKPSRRRSAAPRTKEEAEVSLRLLIAPFAKAAGRARVEAVAHHFGALRPRVGRDRGSVVHGWGVLATSSSPSPPPGSPSGSSSSSTTAATARSSVPTG